MKTVRLFSVVLAVALVAVAFSPFAVKPAEALGNSTVSATSPVESFMNAAAGLPLLAPLNAAAPSMTIRAENITTSVSGYGCTLISQSPADYTRMRSRQYFDAVWNVRNSGQRIWNASAVSFKYLWGAKMQTRGDSFGLNRNIGLGKKVSLVVDMVAPRALGGYSTTWVLVSGNQPICRLTLTLAVTRP